MPKSDQPIPLSEWDDRKIHQLMIFGAGNPNARMISALRWGNNHRNATFLRIYLFLNPQLRLLMPNWDRLVKP
jgi:hypothetical protein